MKKIVIIITILSILFSSAVGVSAATDKKSVNSRLLYTADAAYNVETIVQTETDAKGVDVVLSDTPEAVKVGETVILTAIAQKHGSTYADNWNNAVKGVTKYDPATGLYTSEASFTAEKPGIYNISYKINMFSGNSDTIFSKTVERTIEVIDPVTVIGAVIKDLTITPMYKSDGTISAYCAYGTTHALWSNNTTTPSGSVYFFFGPSETTKNIDVALNINGQTYNYTVTVSR